MVLQLDCPYTGSRKVSKQGGEESNWHLSLCVSDDLAGESCHAGYGTGDDRGGGQGADELWLGPQRRSTDLRHTGGGMEEALEQ